MQPPPAVAKQELEKAFYAAIRRRLGQPEAKPAPVSPPSPPSPPSPSIGPADKFMGFAGELVVAIREGRKTVTRRPMRPQPAGVERGVPLDGVGEPMICRLATPGGRLWVREPWVRRDDGFAYAADGARGCNAASYMPRAAARLCLRVGRVTCERLQDITDADARAEGIPPTLLGEPPDDFRRTWDTFYGRGEFAWHQNPWIWAIRFNLISGSCDSPAARR